MERMERDPDRSALPRTIVSAVVAGGMLLGGLVAGFSVSPAAGMPRTEAASPQLRQMITSVLARNGSDTAVRSSNRLDVKQQGIAQQMKSGQLSLDDSQTAGEITVSGKDGAAALTTVVTAPSGGLFSRPTNGPITSPFGMRFHPVLHVWKLHTGTDFGVPCGAPIGAAADGTVVFTGWGGGYGWRIVVDHGTIDGRHVQTSYSHLSVIGVQLGQKVSRHQMIAQSGTTGYSTGCHLHFEVLVNGGFTDPMPWLTGQPSTAIVGTIPNYTPKLPAGAKLHTKPTEPSESPSPSAAPSTSAPAAASASAKPSTSASAMPSVALPTKGAAPPSKQPSNPPASQTPSTPPTSTTPTPTPTPSKQPEPPTEKPTPTPTLPTAEKTTAPADPATPTTQP